MGYSLAALTANHFASALSSYCFHNTFVY